MPSKGHKIDPFAATHSSCVHQRLWKVSSFDPQSFRGTNCKGQTARKDFSFSNQTFTDNGEAVTSPIRQRTFGNGRLGSSFPQTFPQKSRAVDGDPP
jgi:hypothetical protein